MARLPVSTADSGMRQPGRRTQVPETGAYRFPRKPPGRSPRARAHLVVGQHGGDGVHATRQRLAQDEDVGLDGLVVHRQHAPGARQPRLHLRGAPGAFKPAPAGLPATANALRSYWGHYTRDSHHMPALLMQGRCVPAKRPTPCRAVFQQAGQQRQTHSTLLPGPCPERANARRGARTSSAISRALCCRSSSCAPVRYPGSGTTTPASPCARAAASAVETSARGIPLQWPFCHMPLA